MTIKSMLVGSLQLAMLIVMAFFVGALVSGFVVGYLHNIYQLSVSGGGLLLVVLRVVGILFPPVGAVLGWIS